VPNRLLKEGIVDSGRIDSLSPEAEVCFYRLVVVADDLGRFDARTAIVRARCFPLKEQSNFSAKVETWLQELEDKFLILRYRVAGEPFLQIMKWDQRVRSNGKYPEPSEDDLSAFRERLTASCGQSSADGGLGLGKGKGLGKGASNANEVRFDAEARQWFVPELLKAQWVKAYPAANVDGELAKAAAWLLANPKNAKSNYARFLTNWLTRAQDRAPAKGKQDDDPYDLRRAA
jgi:hypothetical protein